MSSTENSVYQEKLWHRKNCSSRLFIGPWDLKSTAQCNLDIENTNRSNSLNHSSEMSFPESVFTENNDLKPPPIVTQSSDGISYVTARSKNTHSSTPYYSTKQRDDYGYDMFDNETTRDDDTISIDTIRPTKKAIMTIASRLPTTKVDAKPATANNKKKKRRRHRVGSKSLLWSQAGTFFLSQKPTRKSVTIATPPTGLPLKQGPVVCMRTVSDRLGSEPMRYKASRITRFNLLSNKWKQVELVLTQSYLTTYIASVRRRKKVNYANSSFLKTLLWPKHRLEYRIHFEGSRRPMDLELFLFSPVDYTFGLRYSSFSGKTPTTVVTLFKARTFLQCQEWYMQLYKLLPAYSKRPFPSHCEVHIPILELTLNLPLEETKGCYEITLSEVKEAVMTVIDADKEDNALSFIDDDMLSLCWSTKERAEWVYWQSSSGSPDQRVDLAICPQSIEGTHRLELREIEHSSYNIILDEGVMLKEPPPVEGFLLCTTNFFGVATNLAKKPLYFASFDQYLFYIPSTKATEPNNACVLNDEQVPNNVRASMYIFLISPYATHASKDIECGERQRRMRLMTEAKGLIDLTEVSLVHRRFNEPSEDVTDNSQTQILDRTSMGRDAIPCTLELVLDSGRVIHFETYSAQTCEIWTNYLSQLVVYWKAQKEAKKEARMNKQMLDSVTKSDAEIANCEHNKEDVVADTRIWSYCIYEQCRDIVKSGILYYKPHHRGTYTKKFFILTTSGWLLFFNVFNRIIKSKSNNHERKGAIDTAGAYFYSGVDCSKKRKGSSMAKAYENSVKVHPSGLVTKDPLMACAFSIWKPSLLRYFSLKQQRLRVYHQDQRLNSNGQNTMFLAESRQEKEEWICALNSVAEHMMRASQQ